MTHANNSLRDENHVVIPRRSENISNIEDAGLQRSTRRMV